MKCGDDECQPALPTLARYNLWATRKLYEHVDALAKELPARRGPALQECHGTLNHLLVGEHELWFRRFAEGVSPRLRLDEKSSPTALRLRERLIEGAAAGSR